MITTLTTTEIRCGRRSTIVLQSSDGIFSRHRLPFTRWLAVLQCLFAVFTSAPAFGADDTLRKLQRTFDESIQPLLSTHCHDCHTGEASAAGLDLKQFEQIDQILAARKRWKKLEKRVLARQMPPEDCEPLDEDSFLALTQWLDNLFNSADCIDINPGRVTLRRLNRIEYQNTIRDLMGIEYQPANDFPGDDVGYGFDNIADVLSLPPILMEKYLKAAEEISQQAIIDPNQMLLDEIFEANDFDHLKDVNVDNGSLLFFTNATVHKTIDVPQSGKYQITINAAGDQAGDEPARMEVGVPGGRKVKKEIRANRDAEEEITLNLTFQKGTRRFELSFVNDFYEPREGQRALDRNLLVSRVAIKGPLEQELPESHRKLFGETPAENALAQWRSAKKGLHRLGSRAFRRPLKKEELDQLLQFYQQARDEGESFEVALRYPVQALLISPHFLFKVETPVEKGQTRELNDFELATSLSYFLWSTMPDNELFLMASQGKLRAPENYRKQVERMLTDPKSIALVDNFVGQWLQLSKLERVEPDPDKFPQVDLQLRQDMIKETKLLVGDLIRNNHSVLDLLSAEHSFVNQRLAGFYGLPTIEGDDFQRVETAAAGRIGLLTQASILTVTSNPNRTSPVKRGKWIMENLLGDEPPPPDPTAMPIEDQPELIGNLRERMEQHRADPNCAVCHRVMDQLGFALENFDAVGRWRDNDEGLPIDSTGELPTGEQFSNAIEMQRMIRDDMRDEFSRCLTEKLLIYATGRGLEYFDECAVDKIVKQLKESDYRFTELIYLIVTSESFLKRRG